MAADTRELIKKHVAVGLVYSSGSDGSLDAWGCDESRLFLAIWMWKIPVTDSSKRRTTIFIPSQLVRCAHV